MMKKLLLPLILTMPSTAALAMENDDPLLTKVMIDQLEHRSADGADPWILEGDAWIGKDLNKLWFKADVEHVEGKTEEAKLDMLYSHAIHPYWDLQVGLRHDFRPRPQRDWLALAVKGLAPYFFEVDASLYLGERGQTSANLNAEYELMFTQRLVLSPELDMTFYGKDDPDYNLGSGLSSTQLGLRLRYEIRREFAPYVGVNWVKKYGQTADYTEAEGGSTDDVQWVIGLRAWF